MSISILPVKWWRLPEIDVYLHFARYPKLTSNFSFKTKETKKKADKWSPKALHFHTAGAARDVHGRLLPEAISTSIAAVRFTISNDNAFPFLLLLSRKSIFSPWSTCQRITGWFSAIITSRRYNCSDKSLALSLLCLHFVFKPQLSFFVPLLFLHFLWFHFFFIPRFLFEDWKLKEKQWSVSMFSRARKDKQIQPQNWETKANQIVHLRVVQRNPYHLQEAYLNCTKRRSTICEFSVFKSLERQQMDLTDCLKIGEGGFGSVYKRTKRPASGQGNQMR